MYTNETAPEQPALFPQQHIDPRYITPLVSDCVEQTRATLSLLSPAWASMTEDDRSICLEAMEQIMENTRDLRNQLIGK